jgi:hypothetical protein
MLRDRFEGAGRAPFQRRPSGRMRDQMTTTCEPAGDAA